MTNEQLTLRNKIIISARPLSENDTLKHYLSEKGAKVLDFPMIEIGPSEIDDNIKSVINNLKSFHWIVFTSKIGVEYFFKTLKLLSIRIDILRPQKIAVVGKSTAEYVRKNGFHPALISSGNTSEDLLKEIRSKIPKSKIKTKILLAFGCLATDTMETGLSDIADVTRIDLYKTIPPLSYSQEILNMIKNNKCNIITFTSPSQVNNFIEILNRKSKIVNLKLNIACIGKTTEKEILKHGFKPVLVSSKSDSLTFAHEIENYLITKH